MNIKQTTRVRRGGAAQDRAVKGLKQLLAKGQFNVGDTLPSERALARELGVARGTMRTTLETVARESQVEEREGRWILLKTGAESSLMSHTIGILTAWAENPVGDTISPSEGWERYIMIGAADAVRAAGLHALALYPDRLRGEEVRRLLRDLPQGIVVSSRAQSLPEGRHILEELTKAGANIVVYGDAPEVSSYPRVGSDHEDGARQLAEWLIAHGRRRILRVWTHGNDIPYWIRGRNAGYERAMREAGLEILPPLRVPSIPFDDASNEEQFRIRVRVMAGYLLEYFQGSASVDALMMETDGICFSAAAACRLIGRNVHDDVMIVGYDNYWNACPERHFETAIPAATMDKLNRRIGKELVRLLLDQSSAGVRVQAELRLVTPWLIDTGKSQSELMVAAM